jgi:hypothetical protein
MDVDQTHAQCSQNGRVTGWNRTLGKDVLVYVGDASLPAAPMAGSRDVCSPPRVRGVPSGRVTRLCFPAVAHLVQSERPDVTAAVLNNRADQRPAQP